MVNQMYQKLLIILISFLALTFILGIICFKNDENTIKIGTKNFTEQKVIAYTLEDIIEAKTDYQVEVVEGMDTSSILNYALKRGDIDLYSEYSSVAFIELYHHLYQNQTNTKIIKTIKQDYQSDGLLWYENLGFDNSNAIICGDYCNEHQITKLSQIPQEATLKFGAPIYFFSRSDGFNLLEDYYVFSNFKQISLDNSLIYNAIDNNQVDLGLAFTTDAKLLTGKYNVIEDDLNAFAKYEAGLVVNQDSLNKYPELGSCLDLLANYFTNSDIQKYNGLVENEHEDVKVIAKTISSDILND